MSFGVVGAAQVVEGWFSVLKVISSYPVWTTDYRSTYHFNLLKLLSLAMRPINSIQVSKYSNGGILPNGNNNRLLFKSVIRKNPNN